MGRSIKNLINMNKGEMARSTPPFLYLLLPWLDGKPNFFEPAWDAEKQSGKKIEGQPTAAMELARKGLFSFVVFALIASLTVLPGWAFSPQSSEPSHGQSDANTSVSSQQANTESELLPKANLAEAQKEKRPPAVLPIRIVDHRIEPGLAKKIARIPLYPIIGLGKALEKALLYVEERQENPQRFKLWQLWLQKHHLQMLGGGMGTGSGFGYGVMIFDDNFLGRPIRFEMPLQHSIKNYQEVGVLLNFGLLSERKLFVELDTKYRSRPREDFFGLGIASRETNRTKYKLQDRAVRVAVGTELSKTTRLDFSAGHLNTNVFTGSGAQFPSTEQVFPNLPGLARGSSLLRYGFSAKHTSLDNPFDPKKGYQVQGRFYWVDSLNSDNFNFYDYGVTADGYLPLGGGRTLAMRAAADLRHERNGGQIPFYLMPSLGGVESMRGYRPYRFRDDNALTLTLEYRYPVSGFADFVIFTDQGQVAPEPGDFSLDGFRGSYGLGMRVKNLTGVAMRIEVARSREDTRIYFNFSPEF